MRSIFIERRFCMKKIAEILVGCVFGLIFACVFGLCFFATSCVCDDGKSYNAPQSWDELQKGISDHRDEMLDSGNM